MGKKLLISLIALVMLMSQSGLVSALELEISGNGNDSDSQVTVTQETQTEVSQTNEGEVTNDVDTSSTTGDNSASENTNGDTTISTGDATTQVGAENTLNQSVAEVGCCEPSSEAVISGNGSGSTNDINITSTNNNTVTVTQTATIYNNISGTADTGNNNANENTGGSVTIKTGDIKVSGAIVNGPINYSSVKVASGNPGFHAKIAENGYDSDNFINSDFRNQTIVFVDNFGEFVNWVEFDLNTGNNSANSNTGGDVSITTGDIDFEFFIKNFVNLSQVEIDCCEFDPGKDDKEDPKDDGEDPKDNGDDDGGDGKGELLPSAAATEAGGPGINGLSDTSGLPANSFFLLGLILVTLGVKFIGESIEKRPSFAKVKNIK